MPKLLLTGFEPFLQFPVNPTEKIVQELDEDEIGGISIVGLVLPVDFEEASGILHRWMEEEQPDAIIMLGLAAGRSHITPERIAININDAGKEPDNHGRMPVDRPIRPNGPDGLFSTLPIRAIVDTLQANGYPASISNTAGTYLCNHVMYEAILHQREFMDREVPTGFIHIPFSHEASIQYGKQTPSWSQKDLIDAIKLAIGCLDI